MNEQMGFMPDKPKRRKQDDMARVDFRLPTQVLQVLEDYALANGVPISEVVRWMVINALRDRGQM